MRKVIGIFEMIVGAAVIADLRWSKREYHRTISGNSKLILLMLVSVLAGFAKGFFGAGWGPIGIGLFLVAKLDPSIVVGSSLTSRVVLDIVGGATYLSVNMVDYDATAALAMSGCIGAALAIRLKDRIPRDTISLIIAITIICLGALFSLGM